MNPYQAFGDDPHALDHMVTPPSPEEDGFSLSPAEVAGVGGGQALTDAPSGHAKTVSGKRFPCRMNPAVPSLDLMEGLRFEISGPDVHENPVEPDESISSALALIGRVTGTDMAADWLEAPHSRIRPISS
ncbi:hypothetical protein [Microbispora sp. NPDC046933]|uniref:hypothetical protein n=1 Tax=Microbispora sp. NPDC046933 TaxID=3155618 RepID=UPI00340C91D9